MQRVVLAVKVLDSACGSDAGVSVFPGRACLCSGVCAHAHVGLAFLHFSVVQRSLGGWEVLTSPFGSWAFASVQMSIEDGCMGLVFAGPLLKGPGLLWLQGWA